MPFKWQKSGSIPIRRRYHHSFRLQTCLGDLLPRVRTKINSTDGVMRPTTYALSLLEWIQKSLRCQATNWKLSIQVIHYTAVPPTFHFYLIFGTFITRGGSIISPPARNPTHIKRSNYWNVDELV